MQPHIRGRNVLSSRAMAPRVFAVLFPSPVERISIYVLYIMFGEFSFESLEMNGRNNKKMLLHLCALCSLYLVWPWVWNHSYAINTYGYVMYGNLLYSLIYIIHMIWIYSWCFVNSSFTISQCWILSPKLLAKFMVSTS